MYTPISLNNFPKVHYQPCTYVHHPIINDSVIDTYEKEVVICIVGMCTNMFILLSLNLIWCCTFEQSEPLSAIWRNNYGRVLSRTASTPIWQRNLHCWRGMVHCIRPWRPFKFQIQLLFSQLPTVGKSGQRKTLWSASLWESFIQHTRE